MGFGTTETEREIESVNVRETEIVGHLDEGHARLTLEEETGDTLGPSHRLADHHGDGQLRPFLQKNERGRKRAYLYPRTSTALVRNKIHY